MQSAIPSGVHIWLILLKAYHSLAAYSSRDWRESGLGDSEFRVLEVLLHKGPLPVNVIGPKVYLTPGSISLAVDRLYAKGFVSRVESETDRRVRVIDLTTKGRTLIRRVFDAHARSMEELAQVLSDTERVQLIEALKKLGKQAASATAKDAKPLHVEVVEEMRELREGVKPGKTSTRETVNKGK